MGLTTRNKNRNLPFPNFPKDWKALLFLYLILVAGVFFLLAGGKKTVVTKQGEPVAVENPWVFYITLLVPVLTIAFPVGWKNIWEAGFDISERKTGKKRWWRYPIYIVLGVVMGLIPIVTLGSFMKAGIYPLVNDFALVEYAYTVLPTSLAHLQWLLVAVCEEIIVITFMAISTNIFYVKWGMAKSEGLFLSVPVARFLWATLHIGWAQGPIMTYILSIIIGIAWTGVGMIFFFFKKKPYAFKEVNIVVPTIAHFIYDDIIATTFIMTQSYLPANLAFSLFQSMGWI